MLFSRIKRGLNCHDNTTKHQKAKNLKGAFNNGTFVLL